MSQNDINPIHAYFTSLQQAKEQGAWIDFRTRKRYLQQLSRLISDHKQSLLDAMNQDYGYRSPNQSLISDVLSSLDSIHYCRQNLARCLKPQKRDAGFPARLFGAKATQTLKPLGLVAIIGHWRQPLASVLVPAAQAIAAGNRVLLLIDERCSATAQCLSQLCLQSPLRDIMAIANINEKHRQTLAEQDWDLVFDRSADLRPAQFQAREWLSSEIPRNHVLIGTQAINDDTALRVMAGKCFNAGQHPDSPHVVWVPAEGLEEFAQRCEDQTKLLYPRFIDNGDYSAIIDRDLYHVLEQATETARREHRDIRLINPGDERFDAQSQPLKIPPTLMVQAAADWIDEYAHLSAPLLTLQPYKTVTELEEKLSSYCPLATLYSFGLEEKWLHQLSSRLCFGQLMSNDVMPVQTSQDTGVGDGCGRMWLRGPEAMLQFCRPQGFSSLSRAPLAATAGLLPPYGETASRRLDGMTQS